MIQRRMAPCHEQREWLHDDYVWIEVHIFMNISTRCVYFSLTVDCFVCAILNSFTWWWARSAFDEFILFKIHSKLINWFVATKKQKRRKRRCREKTNKKTIQIRIVWEREPCAKCWYRDGYMQPACQGTLQYNIRKKLFNV